MDPIKVDFSKERSAKKKEIVIPPEKGALKIILSVIGALIVAVVAFYVMLPAINPKSYDFYLYIGIVAAAFIACLTVLTGASKRPEYMPYVKRKSIVPAIVIGILALTVGIGWVVSSVFFHAGRYSELISNTRPLYAQEALDANNAFNGSTGIQKGSLKDELNEETAESFSSIPKLDEDAASSLATRALSELASLGKVSQFTVYPEYTQINYQAQPVRVVPLQYSNIIKWITNTGDGLPGYIIVDMANESTSFVECTDDKGGYVRYSPAEHFNELLKRHLRFEYPTYMFGDSTFEIDDSGKPFWVTPVIDKTIGLFGGEDVKGIILCEADGTCHEYTIKEIIDGSKDGYDLTWLDRIYNSDMLVSQYNYFGKFNGGFWNSLLGQKNVYVSTSGYNYIAKDDDVYMYTGITSITSDDSITGFILINQRTKQSIYYEVPGGTETSAQEAAEGRVKEKGYTATFPLLLNIGGEPTYFLSLKDASSIVQQYALINVRQYNKIGATGDNMSSCLKEYIDDLESNGIKTNIDAEDVEDQIENEANGTAPDKTAPGTDANTKPEGGSTPEKPAAPEGAITGTVADIREAVIGGNTVYYVKLAQGSTYYSISAAECEDAIILSKGDSVAITVSGTADGATVKADDLKIQ